MQTNQLIATLLVGGILVVPAFGQTPASPPADPQEQKGSREKPATGPARQTGSKPAHVAGAAGEGEGTRVGKADHMFLTKAAQGGMMALHLAQMAQQKAAGEEVKEYARKLEQDHKKANEELKKIAEERGVSLPSEMPAGLHDKEMQRLSGLSGEEFDRAFMKMQVQHDKKDVKEFQKHVDRSMDSAVKEFASAQIPVLQEHLRQAEQLAAQSGTRARKSATAGTTSQEGQNSGGRDKSKPPEQRQ